MAQGCDLIGNVAVAADGAGVGGVAAGHTGGSGDSGLVVMTLHSNGNGQNDVALQGSAVHCIHSCGDVGIAVACGSHNAAGNRDNGVIGAAPGNAAVIQIHSLAVQVNGGVQRHGTVGLELGCGRRDGDGDLGAAGRSHLLEQADIGGSIVASDGKLGTVVVQVPDIVVLVAEAVVAVAVIVQLPIATVGIVAVADVHIGVGVIQPGIAVLGDQGIIGGAAGLGRIPQEVPLQVGGHIGDDAVLDGHVLGGGIAAIGLQGHGLILGNDQVLVVAAVVHAVGIQFVIGGLNRDGVEGPAAAVVGSGAGGVTGSIIMLTPVIVQVIAAQADVPAAVGRIVSQGQCGGSGDQRCGAVAHSQILAAGAAVLHIVGIAGNLGDIPAVGIGKILGAVQGHPVVLFGVGQGLGCLGVDQIIIGAGGDGGRSATQGLQTAGQTAAALINRQGILGFGCLRLGGSGFGGSGLSNLRFRGNGLSNLRFRGSGLSGCRLGGSVQLLGGGIGHRCSHDQCSGTLGLVCHVGILVIVLIRGADAGRSVGILHRVVTLGTGHLVIDHAVEGLQAGFAVGFADPSVVVCLHHRIGHHGGHRGLQLVGSQGRISDDHVVPQAGAGILVLQHTVKQDGQIIHQALLVCTLGHHIDGFHQRHGIPADATAPEVAVALGTVPAVMVKTGLLVQHIFSNPLKAVIDALVNIRGVDRAADLALSDGVGVLHLKDAGHVQAVQTKLPGGPGRAVHLVPVVVAVIAAQHSLLLQLLIDVLDGIGKALAIGLVVQQFEHTQGHGNRVHFAGVIVLGRTVGIGVVLEELRCIGQHLIGAHHDHRFHHGAVEITPAVLLAFRVPGQAAGGEVVLLVGIAQLVCVVQNLFNILCSRIRFACKRKNGAHLEHHDQCQKHAQRPFHHFHIVFSSVNLLFQLALFFSVIAPISLVNTSCSTLGTAVCPTCG